jgi:hypothetical protein
MILKMQQQAQQQNPTRNSTSPLQTKSSLSQNPPPQLQSKQIYNLQSAAQINYK